MRVSRCTCLCIYVHTWRQHADDKWTACNCPVFYVGQSYKKKQFDMGQCILAMYYVALHGANIQVSKELGSRSSVSGCIQRVLPAALGQYEHHDDNKTLNGG